ncbi:hypothetical protein OSB04_026961 [Centaurea solstitialis]|uniref:60S acidic ribosomal protein P2 n=1 Tax=Centaurea solstitialis TaxID=347529 RepID=A0AA38W6D4_9ASTR|nr:hypothetical protein OSB04_026961 [Centaurea solstitialis]
MHALIYLFHDDHGLGVVWTPQSKMKVVAAYLLALLGGNTSPSAEDLKKILGSVGADCDEDRIELLLSEVKGKDITELIAAGREKLASVPSGGGGVAVAAAAGGGGAAPAAAAAAETKKEEKVEEKEESDDVSSSMEFICVLIIFKKMVLITCSDFSIDMFCRIWDSVCLTEDHGIKYYFFSHLWI